MSGMGWQRYLYIGKESTWGTAVTPALQIPYADYSVAIQQQSTQADLFCGIRQRRHNRRGGKTLSGALSMPLWAQHISSKSIAQWLLDWAFSAPSGVWLDSFTAELYEVDSKQHVGLRVESLQLQGDAQSNAVNLTLNLQGKQETGGITPPTLDLEEPLPVEFLFEDVELYLSSGDEDSGSDADDTSGTSVAIESFNLSMSNSLQVKRANSDWPTAIAAGRRTVDFSMSLEKSDDTYDALRRASSLGLYNATLKLVGDHNGSGASGTNTTILIDLDRIAFANATDNVTLDELEGQGVDWTVLKPDGTNNEIDFTFGLE